MFAGRGVPPKDDSDAASEINDYCETDLVDIQSAAHQMVQPAVMLGAVRRCSRGVIKVRTRVGCRTAALKVSVLLCLLGSIPRLKPVLMFVPFILSSDESACANCARGFFFLSPSIKITSTRKDGVFGRYA